MNPPVGLEMITRAKEMLVALGVSFGETPDGLTLVLPTPTGGVLLLSAGEVDDAAGEMWPVSMIDVPLMTNVDPASLPPGLIARLNDQIVIGKVCIDQRDNTLTLRHEVVGWPGPAEWRVSIQALIGHAERMPPMLSNAVAGTPPPSYEDLLRAGARRVA
ncbi:hypothetical protein OM076_03335 [Solirubrobacter ginsenosidimutans]|uniref:Uncharacterized protein n=1 Tax=Solirubrobacter ginsenosidimutans TaxID=490573 RepID=A0A9X3MQA5_9ACTN|nr:hypothetical protein [Solirubrobacter ginsenosidimutans]MDA0159288.1 hypothetical protein [Solirubrobacter ginsenosidimutans]